LGLAEQLGTVPAISTDWTMPKWLEYFFLKKVKN
jgi:hypothetical protein